MVPYSIHSIKQTIQFSVIPIEMTGKTAAIGLSDAILTPKRAAAEAHMEVQKHRVLSGSWAIACSLISIRIGTK